MSNKRLVWSDDEGDLRKKHEETLIKSTVDLKNMVLKVRRLTSGKGRTVIEITGLPKNKKWCEDLAKGLKKSMGVGGTYKDNFIEIHGEKINQVTAHLDFLKISWKKTGG